jgi:hypothetical protein
MYGLDQKMSVYTPNEDEGDEDFTVLDRSQEPCRLITRMDKGTEDSSDVREEQTGRNRLLWGPDYTMPGVAQVVINGVRWNVVANSQEEGRTLGGARMYWRCDLVQL